MFTNKYNQDLNFIIRVKNTIPKIKEKIKNKTCPKYNNFSTYSDEQNKI